MDENRKRMMGYRGMPWMGQVLLVITHAIRNRWEWALGLRNRKEEK